MNAPRVILSGGGTGGHLFPALVLGRRLAEAVRGLEMTYVGSGRPGERALMARQNVRFLSLRVEGLKGRGWRSLRAIALLPASFARAFLILRETKPRLVVGVGGYSSGPVVLLAAWMGIPTMILEQNVRPGFTNRLLLPWVRTAVAAFEVSLPHFKGKGVFLGNPIREAFYAVPRKAREERLSVLVFGGSQGSRFLNRGVTLALPILERWQKALKFVHQTGPADAPWVRRAYAESGFDAAIVAPFIEDMAAAFAAADLVVCRAGATTCAELAAARRAAILVPFAKAADDHQTQNAAELVRVGGAEMILEAEWSPKLFAQRLLFYLSHRDRLKAMEDGLTSLRTEGAADGIAGLALALMKGRP
ncbi:MAG: undecaprenyldiphospho-muramoylpentapeptide beta-N-acetylglucosaminyltransferase [Candidatus Aminicenantes bacterium]|nr:undecaprenyldiphospho-muramoylpentapeptide beta-N-acetylglucosaminyltransferase [Candidatus Aminicenantes bacterium]